MVDVVFPALAFAKKLILRMKFESSTKIRHITRPILFISGEQVSWLTPTSHIPFLVPIFVFFFFFSLFDTHPPLNWTVLLRTYDLGDEFSDQPY